MRATTREEHEAVEEIIAAFEQETGKQVKLVFHPEGEHLEAIVAALEADQPPDFTFGFRVDRLPQNGPSTIGSWISGRLGHLSDLFDLDALAWMMLLNEKTGLRALYALPMGRATNHVQVWKSLLEQAGFTLRTSRGNGRRFGHSGATRCNRRCAGPRAATTSGVSGFRCLRTLKTLANSSNNSWVPTRRIG